MDDAGGRADRLAPGVAGVVYALAAYGAWGITPIYWKALDHVSPTQILGHRVVWSLLFTVALLLVAGRWRELPATLRSGPPLAALALSGLLISVNWLIFLWAVLNDRLLETSLGYYLNPLVNVVLGVVVLGERLRPAQGVAVALAACGVASLAAAYGGLPWVSLSLASSFACYGLLRKLVPVQPLVGLAIEMTLLTPLAAAYLVFLAWRGDGVFAVADVTTTTLLMGAGPATALPLLWFASAARRLPLGTLGFFQYIAPSLTFLLAVLVYREPFTASQAIAFGFIWTALLLYSADSVRSARRVRD